MFVISWHLTVSSWFSSQQAPPVCVICENVTLLDLPENFSRMYVILLVPKRRDNLLPLLKSRFQVPYRVPDVLIGVSRVPPWDVYSCRMTVSFHILSNSVLVTHHSTLLRASSNKLTRDADSCMAVFKSVSRFLAFLVTIFSKWSELLTSCYSGDKTRWAGHVARVGGGEVHAGFWSADLRERTTWKI